MIASLPIDHHGFTWSRAGIQSRGSGCDGPLSVPFTLPLVPPFVKRSESPVGARASGVPVKAVFEIESIPVKSTVTA